MWAALLGAIVGGCFAIIGGLSLELRRDRRRQIAAARLVLFEFRQSRVQLSVADENGERQVGQWFEGPHPAISGAAWLEHAAEFVGALDPREFESVERVAIDLRDAGDWGFTVGDTTRLPDEIDHADAIIRPLAMPTKFDRFVWRL